MIEAPPQPAAGEPLLPGRVVREFAAGLADTVGQADLAIHPHDEMFLYNLGSLRGSADCASLLYYFKGHQILRTVREIARWRFGSLRGVASMLDFASGYGRLTRFLARELEPDRIWISEISAEAVSFQRERFRVHGVIAPADPAGLILGRRFEFVFAASFFSHLPESAFGRWLESLFSAVVPGGILVFSVHGRSICPIADADWSRGIVFLPESESRTLDREQYGTSYVSEDFVRAQVMRATGGRGRLKCFPLGLCAYQDLYVVSHSETSDLLDLELTASPRGDLDKFSIEPGGWVGLEGWTIGGTEAGGEPEVILLVNNRVADRCVARRGSAGDPAARWSFRFDGKALSSDDVLLVKAIDGSGFDNVLALGTLRPFLPAES